MIDTRTTEQRLADLEHDNNALRVLLADVQRENLRLSQQWEGVEPKITRLVNKVNEFVSRFAVVN